ncbi:Glycosyl transferase family 2 [Flavobacterium flevense]|uniref:Glycosyl transferase n=1 Tax=Flavobacterium flevense TaxID=983 RepID=A0A4Y4AR75_9FLAO|nr:glycosyltransferase family 2 protein [Flavobacterium flevense]GEC70706.1 glycosyl transferase [Flavobacterium flevense]SHL51549.1 Glycosyl transferase family 2 [Flavobacterium flevense]
MTKPLVSILIPTFNSAQFIAETIASVQQQTYENWEIIVVDDVSTDGTVALISKIREMDVRIQLQVLERNSGTGVARNTALAKAKGKYIAFLDADDLWKPEKLEKQILFMQMNDLPFTFSFYDCIDEQGNSLNRRVKAPRNLSYRQLFFCNYVGNLTGVYDVEFFGKITISSIRKRQDWMHWLTILKKIKKAKPVPESLAFYRIRDNSLSTSKTALIRYNFAVYRQFHGYNLVVSLLCMTGFLFTQLVIKPLYSKSV